MIDPQTDMLAWAATLYAREQATAARAPAPEIPFVTVHTASLASTPFTPPSVEETDPPPIPVSDAPSGPPAPPYTMTVTVTDTNAGTFSAPVTAGANGTGPNGYYGGYTSSGYPVIEIYVQQSSSGVWQVTWYFIASFGHEYEGVCTKSDGSDSPLGDYTGTSSTATATSP